jgi:hypothetical protein
VKENELLEAIKEKSLKRLVSKIPYWINVPAVYPVISMEKLESIEKKNGFKLPLILKKIYSEIGNGGQSLGIMGIACKDDPRTNPPGDDPRGWEDDSLEFYLLSYEITLNNHTHRVLPFCDNGCNTWYCVVLDDGLFPVYLFDGGKSEYDDDLDEDVYDECWTSVAASINNWFEDWLEGKKINRVLTCISHQEISCSII